MSSTSITPKSAPGSAMEKGSLQVRVDLLEAELASLVKAMQSKDNFLKSLESRVVVCEELAGVGIDFASVADSYGIPVVSDTVQGKRGRADSEDTRDTDDMMMAGVGSDQRVLGYKYTYGSEISNMDAMSMASGGSPNKRARNSLGKRKAEPKFCTFAGCHKMAHGPTYLFCLRHGGGYRCQEEGCTRSAYSTKYCSRHGGGPRCQWDGCGKGAISNSSYCRRHGGGSRCQHPNCPEGARQGFNFCLNHGGFNPCAFPHCPGIALLTSNYCRQHNAITKIEDPEVVASLMEKNIK